MAVGDLTVTAGATDVAVYVVFLAVNAVVVVLRFRQPDAERPFHVAGAIARLPVIPVVATLTTLVMIPQLRAESLVLDPMNAVLLVTGVPRCRLAEVTALTSRAVAL